MTAVRHLPEVGGDEHPLPIDAAPIGLLITDARGLVVDANRAWQDLTGCSREASLGEEWLAMFAAPDRNRLRRDLGRVLASGTDASDDYALASEASPRWFRCWLRYSDSDDHGPQVVIAVSEVTADKVREVELSERATHDALTGLVNRDQFLAFVDRALRRLDRHREIVAVVFIDLDRFKAVNDSSGHLVGDRVLAGAARRLREAVRPADVVARIGGDEFAVLCDVTSAPELGAVAGRVRTAFSEPIEVDGNRFLIGATVGAALADRPDSSPEALVDAADRAMYEAKVRRRLTERNPAAEDATDVLTTRISDRGHAAAAMDDDVQEHVRQVLRELRAHLNDSWESGLATAPDGARVEQLAEAAHLVRSALISLERGTVH